MNASITPKLRASGLSHGFDGRAVLRDLDLSVRGGEFVSIIGPSGSGKSTLLSILTGGLRADAGALEVDGRPVERPDADAFAFMPQRDVLLPWKRIVDNAAFGLQLRGVPRAEARRRVASLLAEFGLSGTERLYPRQLSGGMRQRVALLRTVVQERGLVFLDEPFGALDAITRLELQQWMARMWDRHRWTVVLVTHDIREALLLSDRVLVLAGRPAGIATQLQVPRDSRIRDRDFLLEPDVVRLEKQLLDALAAHTAAVTEEE
ncbi:ABC transporter ATP-binding protein [Leucobacter weissii]|uniref:ABC transporter ATP-binding protein n=1 Tax=Leucobacter weissii TaxID=1983706 RepID=A0A939MLF1_9MICO|nr:ABC transporter ATP-binding protein [Leucobacter weissii]MBO1900962.1 ABC transporter ATP-binding protein [Leucobacter weissii]